MRAVFLDRDGTINEEKDYLIDPADFVFIAGAPQAIARLNRAGFTVVVVTNQSGVARGYFSLEQVDALHDHMRSQLARYGARLDAIYICPHYPQGKVDGYSRDCDCRKGKAGMLLQAAADLGIDLARSYMIGDKEADLQAGQGAGCTPILVRTGYGETTIPYATANRIQVVADLPAAVSLLLTNSYHKG